MGILNYGEFDSLLRKGLGNFTYNVMSETFFKDFLLLAFIYLFFKRLMEKFNRQNILDILLLIGCFEDSIAH